MRVKKETYAHLSRQCRQIIDYLSRKGTGTVMEMQNALIMNDARKRISEIKRKVLPFAIGDAYEPNERKGRHKRYFLRLEPTFTLEDLKTKRIVIWTETQESFNALMQKFEKHKIPWASGDNATQNKNYWLIHKKDTECGLGFSDGYICYGRMSSAKKYGYTIISPDQIKWRGK